MRATGGQGRADIDSFIASSQYACRKRKLLFIDSFDLGTQGAQVLLCMQVVGRRSRFIVVAGLQ